MNETWFALGLCVGILIGAGLTAILFGLWFGAKTGSML
jgi:hypothetical protein